MKEPINVREVYPKVCANCKYLVEVNEGFSEYLGYDDTYMSCTRDKDGELQCDPTEIERTVCDGFKYRVGLKYDISTNRS